MTEQYKIAELVFDMAPRFSPLLPQSAPYRYRGDDGSLGDLTVTEEIYQNYERRYPEADRPLIEYMASGAMFYETLLSHSGLLLHASAVEWEGRAYLFSAPSGTGKSTHTALWVKHFPGAVILNDDKPAIRILPDGIYVYGTPWSGKTDLNLNRKVPLQGICFLSRGQENSISSMSSIRAIPSILEQTVRPRNKERMERLLSLVEEIIEKVPIYQMQCNMDVRAAQMSRDAMKNGGTI